MQEKADAFDEFAKSPFNYVTPELQEQLSKSAYDAVRDSVWAQVDDSVWNQINKKIDG